MNQNLNIDEIKKEQDKLKEDIGHYRRVMQVLGSNVPIQTMCLPKEIETILINAGYERVCDLFGCDLTKIKGLGDKRISLLASRLDEFFSICI